MEEDRMLSDEVLLALIKKNSGGGGTSDYPQLKNKPEINGVTLIGDKSASDLSLASLDANGKVPAAQLPSYVDDVINGYLYEGHFYEDSAHTTEITGESGKIYVDLETNKTYRWSGLAFVEISESLALGETASTAYAGDKGKANADAITAIKDGQTIDSFADVETALAGKQDVLTAGNYISIANDGTISVTQGIGVYDLYSYKIEGRNGGGNYWTNVIKSVNGVQVSSDTYFNTQAATAINIDDMFTLRYGLGTDSAWHFTLLTDSNEHQTGEDITWKYNETKDFTETFNVSQDESTDLATKGDIDAAVSRCYHHAGTKTCAELVAGLLVAGNEGNVYNMTDSGTTTADFIEGAGQPIKAGDNVGIAKISDGVYKFDLLSGFVDTTNFVQKSQTAGLLKNDGTVNDEIEGDVATLKSGLTNLSEEVNGDATVYPYADVITIEDAVPSNLADCNVKIEPVQDLHGYDKPWVGGAGKNKLPMTVDGIKAANIAGTWSGNAYTVNGVTFTVNTDNDGNVTEIKATGTANSGADFSLFTSANFDASSLNGMKLNGITGGSSGTYMLRISDVTTGSFTAINGDNTISSLSNTGKVNFIIGISSGYSCPSSGLSFYPMIRLSTETDATFAPYTNICPISGHTEASVQTSGFNIWDEDWELGTFDSNGSPISSETSLRSKNYIPVRPNTAYYFKRVSNNKDVRCYFYDSNHNYIQNSAVILSDSVVFNTGDNFAYMKFVFLYYVQDYTTYQHDICINISNPVLNGKYEPFKGHDTYTIALGDTIYGGTVNFDSGVMTVDREYVLIDSDTQLSANNSTQFYVKAEVADGYIPGANVISDKFDTISGTSGVGCFINSYGMIRFNTVTEYNTIADLIADMTSIEFVSKLATPLTVQLTAQQIQLLKGTNTLTASTGQISVTVNGVSGSIGSMQEQVNEIAEDVENITSVRSATAATNVTIDGGGYITVGNMVIVNIEFTANENIASNTVLLNLPNELLTNTPINIYDKSTYNILSKGRIYNGKLMASEQVASSNSYYVAGVYIKS